MDNREITSMERKNSGQQRNRFHTIYSDDIIGELHGMKQGAH